MNKMQNLLSKINRKSKKTIAAVTVAAAVLFAALTGVTALTVYHFDTEPAQTTLPVAEEVTAAEADEVSTTAANAASTAPTSTTTPAKLSGATNSASSNNSTGSKTNGKTGSSANSGSASHSSGTNSKPASGSNSSNNSSAKPSGGSTAKPTTKPVTTTQPAKKEFAMTKQEIIDYASNYIVNTYHCTYYDGFGKDVPGTGYNSPMKISKKSNLSEEEIKRRIRGSADATYIQNGWYKVYVEMEDEDTMVVYLFY